KTMVSSLCFWAKLGNKDWSEQFHPVLCHLIDVGQVARAIWEQVLRKPSRERIAGQLGLASEEDAGRWIAFWSAAHDIGKVTPCFQFQGKTGTLKRQLAEAGFGAGVGN